MSKYKLTVAIPTYNRPKQLGHTLSIILPQILDRDEVQLLILDNCSPVPAADVLNEIANGIALPERIRVFRHVANIGANGNILRCFELADGDWLWCLGDDDEPAKDALATILCDTRNTTSICYAYYRIFKQAPILDDCKGRAFIGTSLEEWTRRVPSYGHRLFISSSIFRLEAIRPYLMTGYMVANSGSPHLTMAFLAVLNGGSYMLSSQTICNYLSPAPGTGYNCAPLAYGSTSLFLLVGGLCTYKEFKLFFGDSLAKWVAPQRLLQDVVRLHKGANRRLVRKCFNLIVSQFKPSICERPLEWFRWTVCQLLAIQPGVSTRLLDLWHRRRE